MPQVKIRLFANLREKIGSKEVFLQISGEKVVLKKVLEALVVEYPSLKNDLFLNENEWNPVYRVFIDGNNVPPEKFNDLFLTDKEVVILPPSGGG